jgi:hypothetical protein
MGESAANKQCQTIDAAAARQTIDLTQRQSAGAHPGLLLLTAGGVDCFDRTMHTHKYCLRAAAIAIEWP